MDRDAPFTWTGPGSLCLSGADVERLRAVAIFQEDSSYLLLSCSIGYLLQAGLSDSALSSMIRALGYPGGAWPVTSVCNATDSSLYTGLPSGLLDPLVVLEFPFPDLLDEPTGRGEGVPWGDIAKITERKVFAKFGLCPTAFRAINYLWQLRERAEWIAKSADAGLPTTAYGAFQDVLDRYLHFAVVGKDPKEIERCRRVLLGRLRLFDGCKWTLTKVGEGLGVSRERVRQMESMLLAKLKKPATLQHLNYFWHLLDRLLECRGGAAYIHDLALAMQRVHDWNSPPADEALASVMEFSPRYRVEWSPPIRVALSTSCCVNCAIGAGGLSRATETAEGRKLPPDAALQALLIACREERCPKLQKISSFTPAMLHFLADSSADLGFSVADNYLEWRREERVPSKNEILDKILHDAGDAGIHFKKVQRRLSLMVPDEPASPQLVYYWLSHLPGAVLWGRGIFKHRDLLQIPHELVNEIQRDVIERLCSDEIPFLCMSGKIFEHYAPQLLTKGVPTPFALYSCMRIVGSDTLSFEKYPFVSMKDAPRPRPSILSVLEQFLFQRVVVTREQLWDFAVLKLGLPGQQILSNNLSNIPKHLRVGALRMHLSNVPALYQKLDAIADSLPKLHRRGRSLEQRLYARNRAVCEAMGVMKPRHLVCLIDHFFPGRIEWEPVPQPQSAAPKRQPRPASRPSQPRPRSQGNLLLNYLEEQGKPCRTKELARFGSNGLLAVLKGRTWALWHSKDALIARSCLKWNEEQQAAIEELALRHLEKRGRFGNPYGLCSELFRDIGAELPALPSPLHWTPVLLHDLLGAGIKFHALGRQRDVFVAKNNPHGLSTLDDLIHHVLKVDYGGTAPRTAFIAAVRERGLSSVKIPQCLKGHDSRIIVEGDIVRAAVSDV
ncbi:hypothetical protein KP004_11335 [Geomonas oryzisoli]|uniref:RNA polymerase sigma-70 region 4 domain-containing protein n=1 Tax=Geomonas oryzisoli TaxID=2847992 RepID=A0ABX8J0S7_9BACT|nr:sigma factor-like helix-turn-helix DNA-binding protein [Geomonas oryzisoli]QWV91825.1 hypothetical protein KP004_11335 [Geomonas oryzisoli]